MQTAAALSPRPDRQFLPSDADCSRSLVRAVAARVLAYLTPGADAQEILHRTWRSDRGAAAIVERAASTVATTTQPGWAAELIEHAVADFVTSLPAGAARLIALGTSVPLGRAATITLPGIDTGLRVGFVGEGVPIPVVAGDVGGATLSPRKLAAICTLTGELRDYSAPAAEAVIRMALQTAAARALDEAVFDDVAGDAERPPGLLEGVVPIAGAAGGGIEALAADIRAAVEAIVDAGGGANVALVASPGRAGSIPILAPGTLYPVIASVGVAPDMLIAVDLNGFASGFSGEPEIVLSKDAVLHMEDSAPLGISFPGSPNVVAAPSRSLWQTDTVALRLVARVGWATRSAGLVQAVSPCSW